MQISQCQGQCKLNILGEAPASVASIVATPLQYRMVKGKVAPTKCSFLALTQIEKSIHFNTTVSTIVLLKVTTSSYINSS